MFACSGLFFLFCVNIDFSWFQSGFFLWLTSPEEPSSFSACRNQGLKVTAEAWWKHVGRDTHIIRFVVSRRHLTKLEELYTSWLTRDEVASGGNDQETVCLLGCNQKQWFPWLHRTGLWVPKALFIFTALFQIDRYLWNELVRESNVVCLINVHVKKMEDLCMALLSGFKWSKLSWRWLPITRTNVWQRQRCCHAQRRDVTWQFVCLSFGRNDVWSPGSWEICC